ncbi:MAG: FAD-dependent oxidoreductase, partial [Microthrixaceae bacterium]
GAHSHLPEIPGLEGTPFHTSDTIMRIEQLPERLIIVGGGFIAAELGHVFSSLGSSVTVVHRGSEMLRHTDHEISAKFTETFSQQVDLCLDTAALSVEHSENTFELTVRDAVGKISVLRSDDLLIATGRRPNGAQLGVESAGVQLDAEGYIRTDSTLLTNATGVWALGDVRNRWQLKHLANQEARVVSHNLLHPDSPISIDQRVVPSAVFSHPQIGSVGLTEQELRSSQRAFVIGSCEYSNVAYGWALEDTTGFVKILIDPNDLSILGAHVLGIQAATLMQQLAQAMQFNIPADRLAEEQIWCHPALPEAIENALLSGLALIKTYDPQNEERNG